MSGFLRRRRLLAPGLGLLAVTGLACTSVARIEPVPSPVDPPAAFAGTEELAAARRAVGWWEDLADPRLAALVEEALAHNWDLAAAAARVEAAIASARIQGADLEPQIGVGAASRRSKQNFIGLPIPGGEDRVLSTTSTSSGLSFSVSWEADLWGRLRARRSAAIFDSRAAAADLEAARLSIAGQVARAYFSLVELALQQRLAERTLDSRSRTLERVEARYERGLAPSLEVRLARTQREIVAAAVLARSEQLDAARRRLEVLAGRYPAGALDSAPELPAVGAPVPAGLPAELLARRPDVVAAEERVYAALAGVGAARASLLPQLSLTGSTGTASRELGDLLDTDLSVWSLAANLLQPLFQGDRLRADVDLAEASRDQTVAAWAQTLLRAFSEVEIALAAERLLEDRLAALARAAEEADRAARLAEDRYLAGLADYLSVLESQRQAFDTESQLLAARRARLLARVDLVLALGGGFEAERPTAAPTTTPALRSPSAGRLSAAGGSDEVPHVR
ncbi:MAG TPA: efflux transporter outer membrane subunit [Thermoanaerobaculia bacterium]|nr:efflux transporter outer membrane subunit [Thermoanaerobaculia bacterium]